MSSASAASCATAPPPSTDVVAGRRALHNAAQAQKKSQAAQKKMLLRHLYICPYPPPANSSLNVSILARSGTSVGEVESRKLETFTPTMV